MIEAGSHTETLLMPQRPEPIMKAFRLKNWFARLSSLHQPQRRQVLDALHRAAGLDRVGLRTRPSICARVRAAGMRAAAPSTYRT
ncbi:hypothetical protein IFT68_10545 [Oxalobacteraceae sp. CFBP 13730]|nr:hypothetical protein [Oxalobacteraceae sp. CFBP 13730]